MTSNSRRARRELHREALRATKPFASCEAIRLQNQINVRTSVLPTVTTYHTIRKDRPVDVPADDKRWMGRDFKYVTVKRKQRVSSGSYPDFLTIKSNVTDLVSRKNQKASLRSRGELL